MKNSSITSLYNNFFYTMIVSFLTGSLIYDIFLIFAAYFLYSYFKFKFYSRYKWKRLNIPYIEPTFLFGNSLKANFFEATWEIVPRYYVENRDKPLLGIWFYSIPILLVQDINLIKDVFVKDFEHFHDRSLFSTGKHDPLAEHLLNLTGTKWRKLRAKLTPIFTPGKIKLMFPLILECGKELQEILEKPAENKETIDWKDISARYTTDIIATCAFGIKANSLKNPEETFVKYGRKSVSPGIMFTIYYWILTSVECLQKILPFNARPTEVTDFFLNCVRETMDYRQKYNIKRNDFMDLMIELQNSGKVDDADGGEITFETVAAQAYVFHLAGFETSSTSMLFTLYELAKNPHIQKKLQDEIDRILANYDNKITYEAVQEMEYLDCVINETLRIHPPAPIIPRICTKDYTFPGTNMKIDKGTYALIPVVGIQNDSRFYPNPEKFDPDRFTAEEKLKRDKFLHIPFGEGPRVCIGKRFGLAMTKTGLVFILSKYNVGISEKTENPPKTDPVAMVMTPHNGMNLKIERRKIKI